MVIKCKVNNVLSLTSILSNLEADMHTEGFQCEFGMTLAQANIFDMEWQ